MTNQAKAVSTVATLLQANGICDPHRLEDVRFRRVPAIPEVELVAARDSVRLFRLYHEFYNVCTFSVGGFDWLYRRKMHSSGPGGIAFFEPGELHVNKKVLAPFNFDVLLFDTGVFERAAEEFGISGPPRFIRGQENNPMVFQALQRFFAAVEQGESALEQQSRFTHCVRLLLTFCVERQRSADKDDTKNRAAVLRAEAYLRENFNRTITLAELCAVAGISRFYLIRSFNKHFGLPPHAYQTQVRMMRAFKLLRTGVLPSAAGAAVGFSDQSHFTRHFRKAFGVPPGRYAAMVGVA